MAKSKKKNEVATVVTVGGKEVSYAQLVAVHTTHLLNMKRKPNLDNAREVEEAVDDYFKLCQVDLVKPTMSGLAMALGISRTTLLKYANGSARINNREIIVQAIQVLEVFDEAMLKEGLMPALAGIFYFKNNYNYTDKTEIVSNTEEVSDEEIERRYRDQHEIVAEVKVDDEHKKKQ